MSDAGRPVLRVAMVRELLANPPTAAAQARRDQIMNAVDTALACSPAAVMWALLAAGSLPTLSPIQATDLALASVGGVAIWWRYRWPLALSLLLSAVSTFSLLTGVAQAIALVAVVRAARPRVVALAALAFFASSPLFGLARPHTGAPSPLILVTRPDASTSYPVVVLFSAAFTGVVVVWGMLLRARGELITSLRDRAQQNEDEQQRRVEQARQLERTRIAREMHDVLAHRISLLSLHAGALEFRPDAPPEEVAKAAGVIRASAHQALQDLRDVIGVLRTDESASEPERPQPTLGEVPALVTEGRRAGAKIDLDVRVDDPDAVPHAIGRTIYRVVQEGLTNARKHANGAAVRVTVLGDPAEGLTVEVRNWLPINGLVPDIPGAGTGIIGLGERVGLAGGRLEYGATTAGDFRLRAWLPWPV
jgi:signal transduction histidine kinase